MQIAPVKSCKLAAAPFVRRPEFGSFSQHREHREPVSEGEGLI